jgi:hypothetical protein
MSRSFSGARGNDYESAEFVDDSRGTRLTGTQFDEDVRFKVTRSLYHLFRDPTDEVIPSRLIAAVSRFSDSNDGQESCDSILAVLRRMNVDCRLAPQ